MRLKILPIYLIILTGSLFANANWQVIHSSESRLILQISFQVRTLDDLKLIELLVGLPTADYPKLESTFSELSAHELNSDDLTISGVSWLNKQNLRNLNVGTLQISPNAQPGKFYRNLRIELSFNQPRSDRRPVSTNDGTLLIHRIVNWDVARNWGTSRVLSKRMIVDYASGTWLQFTIREDGMYAIPHSLITDYITASGNSDPASYSLFTGSSFGRDQSANISAINQPLPENLVEVPVEIVGGGDGSFDSADKIIFSGQGASGFDIKNNQVKYHQSIFYDQNIYWLLIPDNSSEQGTRINTADYTPASPNILTVGDVYSRHEQDILNPYDTGNYWTGPPLARNTTHTVMLNLPAPANDYPSDITVSLLGAGQGTHSIKLYHQSKNNNPLGSLSWSGNFTRQLTKSIDQSSWQNGSNSFLIENDATSTGSKPYFDFLTLRSKRNLSFSGEEYDFYIDPVSSESRIHINSSVEPVIWDISNPAVPLKLSAQETQDGFVVDFVSTPDIVQHFALFNYSNVNSITTIEQAWPEFNTIRNISAGFDHVIIGPAAYESIVNPLVQHRGNSVFTTLEQVYNDFSGGNPDPIAIRTFMQWALESWVTTPTCLFLIGDVDHDYRNITGKSKITVPTLFLPGSEDRYFPADDQLVTIYGSTPSFAIPSIAIGRFPAHNGGDIEEYIDKLIAYETNPEPGLWRQRVTLVADDGARPENEIDEIGLGKSHTNNSESLLQYIAPSVTVQKLYMLEYPEVSDASSYGIVKPAATQALLDLVNRGTAIVSYIGHGSAQLWAQERLLDMNRGDLNAINTGNRLPIWIAATCSWGHFDHIDHEAFSEEIIRAPGKGAAAIISTCRPIGVGSNYEYIKKIFQRLYPNRLVTREPIGVILQSVKTGGISGKYFHLFGDPGMPLPIPADTVSITDIDPDTLRTLEVGSFNGRQEISTAGGTGYVMIQDADRQVTRQYQIASTTQEISYTLPGGTLFRGQFSVSGNEFDGQLRIPNDISFSPNPGKLTVYFQSADDPPLEALGYLDDLRFAAGSSLTDVTGPQISFATRTGRILHTGDNLPGDQGLIIKIADPIGINVAGEIGHGITLSNLIDGSQRDLTNDFIYDINSITQGSIDYSDYLTGNRIDLKIKAWDSANNPTETTLALALIESQQLKLFNTYNYPNPFAGPTQFTFELTIPAEVKLTIYSLQGRRIYAIPAESFLEGYHHLDWNGRDEYGNELANGVYLYQIEARNSTTKVSTINKIAKYR